MHLEETANIVENVDLKLPHTFTRPLQTYFKLFARSSSIILSCFKFGVKHSC